MQYDGDMVPMAVEFSPVADSIDRFDGGSAEEMPTIRKDFPESFLWEDIEGYDDIAHRYYVFSYRVC
jgi:hypothetical protein